MLESVQHSIVSVVNLVLGGVSLLVRSRPDATSFREVLQPIPKHVPANVLIRTILNIIDFCVLYVGSWLMSVPGSRRPCRVT
ncbi:hypothetical protein F5Y06DRAFT_269613 [Hypoxylon sp. FL0890]|nr:hypothetical protein F5Y06DRAFT_269613 [Hypoxylon sp. FL0890]